MDQQEVQQRARKFIANLDISNIHNDLSVYTDAVNAKLKMEELDEGESGYTVTKKGKNIIVVNSLESDERQRFTICHEVAHIALELPSSHEEVPLWAFAKRHPDEMACDTFAAELLMPYKEWLSKVPKEEPSISIIEKMAEEFGTSFPAAASRYASLNIRPCAFVTMEKGIVKYSIFSTSLRNAKAWITQRSPIPQGSIAYRLREAGESGIEDGEIDQDIWFENWEKGLLLWECSRHYASTDTTVALLWLEDDELPEVEVNRFGTRVEEDGGLAELTGELPWPGHSKRR